MFMASLLAKISNLAKNLWSVTVSRTTTLAQKSVDTLRSMTHSARQTLSRLVKGAKGLSSTLASPIQNMPKLVRSLALAIVLLVPAALAVSAGQAWHSVHLAREEERNALPAVEVPLAPMPTPLPAVVPTPILKEAPKSVVKPKVIAKPCINDSKLKPNQRCVPKTMDIYPLSFDKKNGKLVCWKKHDKPHMSHKYSGTHVDRQCCLDPDEIPNPWCTY